jgi:anti-sigma regulatory factor (Ser/Thr protein kinase)
VTGPPWVTAGLDVRSALVLDRPATAPELTSMRRAFAAWLAVDTVMGEPSDDLVLAVYEALTNAADHAYPPGSTGPVRLVAHRTRDAVRITVSDDGRWRRAHEAPFRHHGLAMMRGLVAQLHIDAGGAGTTVHLCSPLPIDRPPAPTAIG